MPIYLCQPGTGSKEPWRHGVQVYARPFPLGGESESDNDDDGDVDPVATREAERVALASDAGTADASTATAAAAAAAASAVATPRGEGVGVSGPANDAAGGAHARGEPNDIHVAREGRGRLEAQDDSDLQGGPLLQQHEQQQVQERRLEMQVIRQRRFAAARALDNSTFSNSNSSLEDEINSDHDNDNNNNVNNDNNNNNQSQQELQLRNSQMQQRRQQRQLQNLQGQQHRHHRKLRHQRQRRLPPVRRVRHAEVVLVDQVLVAFRRYWLRLRWPGEHGGFGGFVALGKLEEDLSDGGMAEGKASGKGGTRYDSVGNDDVNFDFGKNSSGETEVVADLVTLSKSASTAEKHTANVPLLLCQETNVPYPSSLAMKLLPRYDDGLEMDFGTAAAADDSNMLEESLLGSLKNGEPVFCRICREGLHDVNYDLETATSAAPQNKADEDLSSHTVDAMRRGTDSSAGVETPEFAGGASDGRDEGAVTAESTIAAISSNLATATTSGDDQQLSSTTTESETSPSTKTPSFPLANLPPLVLHHPTAENPLLAPCKCAGSMAFVHYLCIEQWRCRSRHPAAKNGLHCETCGAEYTLPPPPSRPTHPNDPFHNNNGEEPGNIMFEDDWLAAMPPHVLAALRRPHPWWQLGAAIVRRKYLRPLVPVFLSPLVALYCRGRRTLKKRGVSRRRWACSLCRRRARWKCVRCLRSYYCSRQCQNVSWHIVHKHVCYKPARFWWSVVVYSVGGVLAVPGVLKEPLVYDFMLTFLPVNFLAMGIIAGGIATDMKRLLAVDIRGRTLEMFVVLLTLWLTFVTSKLVRGYFGDPSQCWGVFASNGVSSGHADESDETTLFRDNIHLPDPSNPVSLFSSPFNFLHGSISNILFFIAVSFLRISQIWFEKWDYYVFSRLGFISRRIICTPTPDGSTDYMNDGCFPSVRNIDPNFFLEEGNESCRADMSLMLFLYLGALAFLAYGSLDRHRRGRVRNAGGQRGHRERRPHQD